MASRFGVRRLWLELALALTFAVAAPQLSAVYAADTPDSCEPGLPALQIELISAEYEPSVHCVDAQHVTGAAP